MIAGIENIEKEISSVLKKYEILDNIEIRYSNLNITKSTTYFLSQNGRIPIKYT